MKKNLVTPIAGALLALIFLAILFFFQVRQTEVAVVTTFGKFSKSILEPGLNIRWPWPIQKVYKLDNRLRNFERKFEQTRTKDGRPLLVTLFIAWKIENPRVYLERFPAANPGIIEGTLESLVRDTKNGVIGQYNFSDLISTNRAEVKLRQLEEDMLETIRKKAHDNYGIKVELVGINRIGLPESTTEEVFKRMTAERNRLIREYLSEGQAEADIIAAEANLERDKLIAAANSERTKILGGAEAEAAKHYAVFRQEPELAKFLFDMKALRESTKTRTTLILDQQTPPFNRLAPIEVASEKPAAN